MARIIYLTIGKLNRPIGGVMVQADHVAALRRAGFDALLSSTHKGERPGWINPEAQMVNGETFAVRPDDVIVLHDSVPRHHFLRFMKFGVRKVFFCQNHYFMDQTLLPHERLADFPIVACICVSEPAAAFVRTYHGIENPVIIRPGLTPRPIPARPRKEQLCLMPRKRLEVAGTFVYRFRYLHRDLSRFEIVEIHDKHPDEVAAIMAESAVFVSLSEHEGLGLPPLEAMRAGCLVVGYHGGGGLDYATAENGVWFDQAVPDELIPLVADTVRKFSEDPAAFSSMIAAGQETAARYSMAQMERDLVKFWSDYL